MGNSDTETNSRGKMKFKILLEFDDMDSLAPAISRIESTIREGYSFMNVCSTNGHVIVMRPLREDEGTFFFSATELP
jgi:hypothetical protein